MVAVVHTVTDLCHLLGSFIMKEGRNSSGWNIQHTLMVLLTPPGPAWPLAQ